MTKKNISLIQAIIQLLALVTLFIPISFIRYFSRLDIYPIKNFQYTESLCEAVFSTESGLWGILLIICSLASLAYFILYFATKIPQLRKKYCIAVPCVAIPILVLNLISICFHRGSEYYNYNISEVYGTAWGFYLIAALYVSIIVLELFKHFSKIDEESKPKVHNTTVIQNNSSADELKKYKDLLDSGIITQEEFDAKKKQLLGL